MSGIGNGRQIGMEASICPSLIIIPHRLALIAYQVTQVDILVLFRFMVTLPSAWCQSWNKSKLSPVLHGTLVPPRARSFPSSSAPSYLLGHFWDIQTPGRHPKPPESGHPGHLLLRSTPVTWQSEGHEIVGLETAESKQPLFSGSREAHCALWWTESERKLMFTRKHRCPTAVQVTRASWSGLCFDPDPDEAS